MERYPVKFTVEKPYIEVGCVLGEGPIYDARTSILHFVDIAERRVYHLNTTTDALKHDQYEDSITCLALCESNTETLACAATRGFGLLSASSKLSYLSTPISPDDQAYTRFNDGACDPNGRFFAGTVFSQDPARKVDGRLYKWDPANEEAIVVDEGPFTDSNGLAWSSDGRTFYFTDSMVNIIYSYPYDPTAGVLDVKKRKVFVDASKLGLQGTCDGLCMDTLGGIWSARWEGSCIVRFTPQGEVDFLVSLPSVWRVTSCAFGGPRNDQLYITSANSFANALFSLGDLELYRASHASHPSHSVHHHAIFEKLKAKQEQCPDSGHLFKLDLSATEYRGIPCWYYRA